jgi:hypothetical protein
MRRSWIAPAAGAAAALVAACAVGCTRDPAGTGVGERIAQITPEAPPLQRPDRPVSEVVVLPPAAATVPRDEVDQEDVVEVTAPRRTKAGAPKRSAARPGP